MFLAGIVGEMLDGLPSVVSVDIVCMDTIVGRCILFGCEYKASLFSSSFCVTSFRALEEFDVKLFISSADM